MKGFRTSTGNFTNKIIIPTIPDTVVAVETFLNKTVPQGFGSIKVYSKWYRKNRIAHSFGGVAICFKNNIQVQMLTVNMPQHLELSFHRLCLNSSDSLLLCVCYRPQWQGSDPINFIKENLDAMMMQYSCKNVIILGDLNQHLVQNCFDDLLDTHGYTS